MKSRGVDSVYSWVVAVACGVVYSLISCPMRLGSLLFVSMKDSYGTSRDAASLPFEMAFLARSISGPLAGYFGQTIGLQKVTMIGSLIATTGLLGCFFANSIVAMDLCLGLVFGFGFGLATALAPEIINQHFAQHRTKAIGIVLGASGMSASITPPLLEIILNAYGESASFLIISGIVLNTIPAAMLLTKPDEQKVSKTSNDNFINQKLGKEEIADSASVSKSNINNSKDTNIFSGNESYIIQTSKFETIFSKDSNNHILHKPSLQRDNLTSSSQKSENYRSNLKLSNAKDEQTSLATLKELNVNDLSYQFSSANGVSTYLKRVKETNSVRKVKRTSMFESINILWTPKFLLITFVQSSHFYIMYIFWTITIDVVRDKGVEKSHEVYFVVALSLFDTIGRFFLASVTDCTRITAAHFSSVCFTIIGMACLLLVWSSGLKATLASICLLGFIIGGNTTSLPGIVTGFIEIEKRPMAMASRLIMYAPMSFTMSPLIGYFREVLSSYNGLLYIMMSMCFACSIVLQILSQLQRCKGR